MAIYPAVIDFVMGNGEEVELLFTFSAMATFEVKKKDDKNLNEVFDALSRVIVSGSPNLLDYPRFLYGCYLMAEWDKNPRMTLNDKRIISYNDWLENIGVDFETIFKTVRFMSDPKFRAAFMESFSDLPNEPQTTTKE